MIPEDILLALILLLIVVVPFVALVGLGAWIAAKRAELVERKTHGGDGGRPEPQPRGRGPELPIRA